MALVCNWDKRDSSFVILAANLRVELIVEVFVGILSVNSLVLKRLTRYERLGDVRLSWSFEQLLWECLDPVSVKYLSR